jgi:hypothetical protein
MKHSRVAPSKRGNAGAPAFDYQVDHYSKWHILTLTRCFACTRSGR